MTLQCVKSRRDLMGPHQQVGQWPWRKMPGVANRAKVVTYATAAARHFQTPGEHDEAFGPGSQGARFRADRESYAAMLDGVQRQGVLDLHLATDSFDDRSSCGETAC